MNIVVLDHDPGQTDQLCQVLTVAGHACHAVQSGADLLNQLRQDRYDLLIFDWQTGAPGSAELMRRARDKLPAQAPVLFLTTSSGEDDIVAGLAAGADDYMVKPLRRGETVARVQAQLRRAYPAQYADQSSRFGPYVFETRPGRLLLEGSVLDVTHKEFSLALLFFRNLGRPLSRAYIQESVWVHDSALPSRTLDTHVSRVRSKLRLTPENGFKLAPVYSYGYRLEKLEP